MPRIAINGLGRMGKLLLRRLADEGLAGLVVHQNDIAGHPRPPAGIRQRAWSLGFAGKRR